MKKKIGKIVALFIAAGLLVNSFFLAAANEGDNGAGESAQEIQESEHTHSWGEETVAEPASCGREGSATVKCTGCDATESRTLAATGAHSYGDWTEEAPATADGPGREKRVCGQCGAEETREIPRLESAGAAEPGTGSTGTGNADGGTSSGETGNPDQNTENGTGNEGVVHNWSAGEKVEPTCTENGKQHYLCSDENCGAVKEEEIPSAGHKVDTWTLEKAPTQEEAGSEYGTCTVCGEKVTRPVPAGNHKHTFNDSGTVVNAASETKDGSVDYFCTSDTCEASEEGISHYYKDNGAGEFLCVNCSAKENPEGDDACAHDWKEKENGLQECGRCHSLKNTAAGTVPGNTVPGEENNNSPEQGSPNAECTCAVKCTDRKKTETCLFCNTGDADLDQCKGKESPVSQEGTDTCSCTVKCTPGSMNGECPVCKADGAAPDTCKGNQTEPDKKPGAACSCVAKCTDNNSNMKCPACSADGANINEVCQGKEPCGEGNHTRPATYETVKKASCTEKGEIRYTCSACGIPVTEQLPRTGHIWDSKTGKCISCKTACPHTENGNTAFDPATGKCSVCGYLCVHSFDEETGECRICGFRECETHKRPSGEGAVIISVKEATCSAKGLERYQCAVCGTEVTEETAADPDAHDWNRETGKCKLCDESCTHEDGDGNTLYQTDGTCLVCGHTCAHEFRTVTEEGKDDIIQCAICGYICNHEEKALVPIKGKGDKEADCKNAGQQTYLCSVCGTNREKELPPSGKHQYDTAGSCLICGDDLYTAEPGDCIHKDSRWTVWENDGSALEEDNPWKYVNTDIDGKTDIFQCAACGSAWEREGADREEKTVDLIQITKGTLGVTISVNGVAVGNNQEVKINKSDVLAIHIDWAIDNDRKPTANTTIQYQLPVILKAVPMADTIWGAGGTVEYGTYSIDANGLLTFRLNDNILKKSEINGSFDLQATLILDEETSSDKQEILFPGGAGIVVYFKSNMTCKKDAKLNNDGSINYKITFELDSDSRKVSLTDTLGSNLSFDGYEGSFLLKDTAAGTQTDITDKVTVNAEKNEAVIDLGDVKKGKYEISYMAKLIDAAANASGGQNTNTVKWKWDGKEGGPVSCKVTVTGKPLWKNSAATTAGEKEQGIYRWEIVINKDMIPVNLSEKTIYDWYEGNKDSAPDDNTCIYGNITVMDITDNKDITDQLTIESKTEGSGWALENNGLFRIKFPYGDYTHVYKISYATQTKATGMDGIDWGFVKLRNWAKIIETGDNDYEDALVGKKYGTGILTKTGRALSNDTSGSNEAYKAQWQVKLDLTQFKNADVLKDLILTDTLPDGMNFYTTDESEMNFAVTLSDGTSLTDGEDYQRVIDSGRKTMTLTFTEAGWRKCVGKQILLTFSSVADSSKIPAGGSRDYINKVKASFVYNGKWSYEAQAKVTMYKKEALNKSGEVLKTKNADGNYEILWTILVNTNDAANLTPEKAYTGEITVTDVLPDGLVYIEGSAQLTTSTRTDWTVSKSGPAAITPAQEGLPGRLLFTIPASTYDNAYKITFKTEVDPASLDKTNYGTVFTNEVLVTNMGNTSRAEADVTIAETDLLKKGGQTTGTHILYTIDVNTNAQQLTSRGYLTLEDEIDSNAEILSNTISVTTIDNVTQVQTDITASCSLSYSGSKLVIGNIPDGRHVRITYKAVTVRTGDVAVTNSAILKGEQELASTSVSGSFRIKAGATASGRAGTFNLIKYDRSDARKTLPGAQFTLYKFNMDSIDATPGEAGTLTTDEDGRITFGEGSMEELEFDVLYCYVETQAPAGYLLDNTPHYFMLEGNSFEARNQLALGRIGEGADYRTYTEDGSKTRQLYNDPYTPPTPPPTPEEPGTPDEPGTTTTTTTTVTTVTGVTPKVDVLGESKMPDGAMPAAPSVGVLGDMKGPGTGDRAPVVIWTLLISTAMAVLISCAAFRKKRR